MIDGDEAKPNGEVVSEDNESAETKSDCQKKKKNEKAGTAKSTPSTPKGRWKVRRRSASRPTSHISRRQASLKLVAKGITLHHPRYLSRIV